MHVNPTTRGFLETFIEFLDISKTFLRTNEYEGFFAYLHLAKKVKYHF